VGIATRRDGWILENAGAGLLDGRSSAYTLHSRELM
jgi:hypothetical protein